jgi:alpha-amylase
MVDVVVNHFAWAGNGTEVDYSTFVPFDDEKYFHEFKLLTDDTSGDVEKAQTVTKPTFPIT